MNDLPAAYLRDLVELVGRWRVTPEQLLAKLPVTPAQLADPSTRVPLVVAREILTRAHHLTNEPSLAIYLGMQMRLSSHGFLGFAAMTSRTLGDAIALAVRFARTRTTLIGLSHYVEAGIAALVFDERVPLGPTRETVTLAISVGLWQVAEALTTKVMLGTIECAFPRPTWFDRWRAGLTDQALERFASSLRFDCPDDRLLFDARLLDTPLVGADPIAAQLAKEQCERELAAVADPGVPGRVRVAIHEALLANRAPALPAVAKSLHLSTRTLKRRLADAGTTFSALVADVRRQRAMLLLDDRSLSIGEVAQKLGYTELPNFTRAFRQWTGITPVAFRDRAR